ncbi:MAG: protein NO VEIN domain-containing protein [Vulcanimicrobiaceae bacterium]
MLCNVCPPREAPGSNSSPTTSTLKKDGYDEILDVPEWESFDFHCRKGRIWRKIEVKGTRTPGESLLFSNAEVALAEEDRVDLYIVSRIKVNGNEDDLHASGGTISKIADWSKRGCQRNALGWQIIR